MSLTRARATKGYLMQLKKRLRYIERGCEFLKLKRDHLAKELTASIEILRGRRKLLLKSLKEAYDAVISAYLSLGPTEVESQARAVKKGLEIEVLPKSTMGVRYPYVKIVSKPSMDVELDITLSRAAERIGEILEDIIRVAEFESRIERLADELGKTNRKVNALENIVIPQYKAVIKFIADKLDEESLEELVRLKLIGGVLARRRE
ncbi:MAG: ATP synthase subunit D [Candidatus Bathyarchaeota archaeon B23]|nr:MAG: ATP synthase subunit D [Candidatus Bathyarchaeota archaeon B23]